MVTYQLMIKTIIKTIVGLLILYIIYSAFTLDEGSGKPLEISLYKLGASIVGGLYLAYSFATYIMPIISQKTSQMILSDNNETVQEDPFRLGRVLVTQGEYEDAIVAYRGALANEPENRMGWTDVAKIYTEKLEQPALAVATYREAIPAYEWQEDDAAFFLFRISEWQINDLNDQTSGIATLEEIRAAYPESRNSANAGQLLRQLGVEPS